MRADFIPMTACSDSPIGKNDEVIADGYQVAVLTGAEGFRALETARFMPCVNIPGLKPFSVRRGSTMNDDAFDRSSHATSM